MYHIFALETISFGVILQKKSKNNRAFYVIYYLTFYNKKIFSDFACYLKEK